MSCGPAVTWTEDDSHHNQRGQPQISDTAVQWGEIAVEQVYGVSYRMYEPRTRRLASLLDHADRWTGRVM